MKRIVVGMSGGVDSSLTAVLLAEQGFEVVGVTMKLWPCAEEDGGFVKEDACCSPTEAMDAREVALDAGLKHYTIDMEAEFRAGVVDDFLKSYARGETPNPCVRCNETVKFGDLFRYAQRVGAEAVGTGHYARIVKRGDRYALGVAADSAKDQTYFLYSLTQEQLACAEFPLGSFTKDEVRAESSKRGLVTADKRESQDICFIGDEGTAGFLKRNIPESFTPGPIKHVDGQTLGEHQGLAAFTIGQRKGLGVAWSEPLYVTNLDMVSNTVWLGPRPALMVEKAHLRDCTWHLGPLPAEGLVTQVRNRYRAPLVDATITDDGQGGAWVDYHQAVIRPSPGQACVAYGEEGQLCLGGGWFLKE